jgi:hypothetical protein
VADTDKSLYNLRYNQITSNLEAFGGGSPQWTLITLNNVDPQQVPVTRQINTTTPLQGGGNLTVDRTLSILQATNVEDGYLSSADWNTFNNKQAAGNYITALTGDGIANGPGSVALTLATVNGNVGTFSNASITVNAKGLITSAANGATGSLTDVGTDGIVITGGTGAVLGSGTSIAQHVADTTHNGYLSSTDWNTFNGKQSPLTFGNLTDVGTDGITVSGGTGAVIGSGTSLSQHVADTTHNGYLASTDWNTFNGKQAAGNYITALTGDITASGPGSAAATLATVNTNVGSFTNASITVNGKGLITAASNGTSAGTVNAGTATHLAYYATSTNAVSDANGATVSGTYTFSGAVTHSATLTMSGATIAMGANKITGLANGSASSDAAAFGQLPTFTPVTSFSPTIAGFGTPTQVSFFYRQMGDVVDVWGTFVAGTVSATVASITLPVNINTGHLSTNCANLGYATASHTENILANDTAVIFYDGSTTGSVFMCMTGTTGSAYAKNAGNGIMHSSDVMSVRFSYPV